VRSRPSPDAATRECLEQRQAERRQRLLAAALHLFTTLGYRQTDRPDLRRRRRVNRNFYEEFTGKEQVLLTCTT